MNNNDKIMIFGNSENQRILFQVAKKKSPAQAYLFSGPEHLGKFSLAMEFAKILTKRERINQDFIWVIGHELSDEKKAIDIETVRRSVKNLSRSFGKNQFQFLIVDNAERMTSEAQNAFLKTLEESYSNNVIILITHEETRLLPTIISRCQKVSFSPSDDEVIGKIVKNEKISEEEKKFIVFWSAGRPGIAKKMLEDELLRKRYHQILSDLRDLWSSSVARRFLWTETQIKNETSLNEILEVWTMFFRQAALQKRLGIKIDSVKALIILESVIETKRLLNETNANSKLLLEQLVLKFS